MERKLISSGSEFETKIGYSRAVVDGDYVFVAGTTGYNYEENTISDDPVEQAEQCFKNENLVCRLFIELPFGVDVAAAHFC